MGLEAPTYVNDFVTTNPEGSDNFKDGDNHIRNVKSALKNTFPDASKAFRFGTVPAVTVGNVSVTFPTDQNKLILVDATSVNRTVSLPTPSGVNADNWGFTVTKSDDSVNTVTIQGGTINGESTLVLLKKYHSARLVWSSLLSAWLAFPNFNLLVQPYYPGGDNVAIADGGHGQDTAYAGLDALNLIGADIASASTLVLDDATGAFVDVTGTNTVTAITLAAGRERWVRAAGLFTINHGASLVMPGSANRAVAVGDIMCFRGFAGSIVRCVHYLPLTGRAVTPPVYSELTGNKAGWELISSVFTVTAQTNIDIEGVYTSDYDEYELSWSDLTFSVDSSGFFLRVANTPGSYETGVNAYTYALMERGPSVNNAADDQADHIPIVRNTGTIRVGNAAGEFCFGSIRFCNPEVSTYYPLFDYASYFVNASGFACSVTGVGKFNTASIIAGLRIAAFSGNITGNFRLYGKRRAAS